VHAQLVRTRCFGLACYALDYISVARTSEVVATDGRFHVKLSPTC
jgi:hypothetical protein